jgi:hypothetical protein
MTRPLTGLSGLAGYQTQIDEDSQATPEERMGGTADPSHSKYLAEDYIRRGAQMGAPIGPYGPDNQMLGDESWFWESGGEPNEDPAFDHTPSKRAGPWPKGILSGPVGSPGPEDTGPKLAQLSALHGIDTNAEIRSQSGGTTALNDDWQTVDQINPGSSMLEPASKQSMSSGYGWGTRDRTVSMARQNEFGFDSAHQWRRFANGGIPGNTMWLRPGGRPMVKSLPGPARPPIGPDSPFAGQNLGAAFDINGAILQNVPSEYVAPPQPSLGGAAVSTENDSVVEWY